MKFEEAINDKLFKTISSCADQLGLDCYVIGGFVRDYFLKRKSKDVDIVVVGSGIEMAKRILPHLIFMDIHMPGIDGFDTAREIRGIKEFNNLPVIGLSADALLETIEESKTVGFNAFLTKPINYKDMLLILNQYLK